MGVILCPKCGASAEKVSQFRFKKLFQLDHTSLYYCSNQKHCGYWFNRRDAYQAFKYLIYLQIERFQYWWRRNTSCRNSGHLVRYDAGKNIAKCYKRECDYRVDIMKVVHCKSPNYEQTECVIRREPFDFGHMWGIACVVHRHAVRFRTYTSSLGKGRYV